MDTTSFDMAERGRHGADEGCGAFSPVRNDTRSICGVDFGRGGLDVKCARRRIGLVVQTGPVKELQGFFERRLTMLR